MSSISSLSTALSALRASESALNTTAHNLTNVNTDGYVRQQVLIKESNYIHIGKSGTSTMSVGLGTDIQSIRQVRDIFLDQSYREESGRQGFYEATATAINEIETILGETEGESFSKILDDLWVSINELSKHPDGLETRGSFVQNAVIFVEKANLIMNQLNDYQRNVNTEITDQINRINTIGKEINMLNDTISKAELAGGNANDFRDLRNKLLDELSTMVSVKYREDKDGALLISVENVPFVIKGDYVPMGSMQAEPFSMLIRPSWPHLNEPVFNFDNPIGPQYDNDVGKLKGLILARGTRSASYLDLNDVNVYNADIKESAIMSAQAQFDNLIHGIVTMINDTVSPNLPGPPQVLDTVNAPYGLNGTQGDEIFSRKFMPRYDAATGEYNVEDPANAYSLYSAGNLMINPAILTDYNRIALSQNLGYDGDSQVASRLLEQWDASFSTLEPGTTGAMSFREYYTGFVGNLGNLGYTAKNQTENQRLMATQIDNQRKTLTGVSSDEELGNMMKYQHAYNAAARVVTTVDRMIEQVVTSLGIVGR